MKPMLAFKTKPSKVTWPLFIQPKLNGIRAMWIPKQQTFQSRDEHLWDPDVLPHLTEVAKRFAFVTDGELYVHGMSLQQINSRVAVNRLTPHKDVRAVEYHIFDIVSAAPMYDRIRALEGLASWLGPDSPIKIVPSHLIYTPSEADYHYGQFKSANYEGAMYRTYDAPYGISERCGNKENRWWSLQKRKDFLDMVCLCVGVNEGDGNFSGTTGTLQCQMDNGVTFPAGSGLTLDQRARYWLNPELVVGQTVVINYEMLSDGGNPLKPTIELVNER